jgi:hypothetical protein
MNMSQISGISIQPSTISQAIEALTFGQVSSFVLLLGPTNTTENGENIVAMVNQSFPRELVFELMEKFLRRPPGSLVDSGMSNN